MTKSEHHNWTQKEYEEKTGRTPHPSRTSSVFQVTGITRAGDVTMEEHFTDVAHIPRDKGQRREISNWGDAACGSGNN